MHGEPVDKISELLTDAMRTLAEATRGVDSRFALDAAMVHWRYLRAYASAVGGVRDDGQMRERFHDRDRSQVEQVARLIVEAAHAALAQDHFAVPFGKDILRAEE